jgi:hypothetical protein
MHTFTITPNKTFQFDLLKEFSEGLGINYKINSDNTIMFSSSNINHLEEAKEQLSSFL